MTLRGHSAWVGLLVLLAADLAQAQRVVVLDIDDDRGGRLRGQVEAALKKAKEVEVVSLSAFREAAAKKKLKGAAAVSAEALPKVAPQLRVAAGVSGKVDGGFLVRILGPRGEELWSRKLPLRRGRLSDTHARKLAHAIAVAAQAVELPPEEREEGEEVAAAESGESNEGGETKPEETASIDLTGKTPIQPTPDEQRRQEELAEAHTVIQPTVEQVQDTDLEVEARTRTGRVAPKLITLALVGSTTWRWYCSRPGVQSCAEYDSLAPADRPLGRPVDFLAEVPYAGGGIRFEVFPLARMESLAKGLGVFGRYGQAFSRSIVRDDATGEQVKEAYALDQEYAFMLAFRYFFGMGSARNPQVGYVGARAGWVGRVFEFDPNAQVALPGSHRGYPAFGVDFSIPVVRLLRFEGAAEYFVNPKAGVDEIAGYGDLNHSTGGAEGRGFAVEAGIAGDVWGPIGYLVKLRVNRYSDFFYGPGQLWTCSDGPGLCGGAAHESYSTLNWGVTVAF